VASLLAGGIAGSCLRASSVTRHPQSAALWLNVLLFGSFMAIGLAASASFDRLPPRSGDHRRRGGDAFFDVLGLAGRRMLQPYSLFHYLKPKAILVGADARRRRAGSGHRRGDGLAVPARRCSRGAALADLSTSS
jgi:hypothetical protein